MKKLTLLSVLVTMPEKLIAHPSLILCLMSSKIRCINILIRQRLR